MDVDNTFHSFIQHVNIIDPIELSYLQFTYFPWFFSHVIHDVHLCTLRSIAVCKCIPR